jgi:hypothetical protein
MAEQGVVRLSADEKALRAADRDPAVTVALVELRDLRHSAEVSAFVRRLESVPLPTVAVLGGRCDASALAVLASVSLGFVTDDIEVSVDADTVLALGLTSSLPAAVGAAPARGLLFCASADAAVLLACGLARSGDADAAARRLADPAAALLVRSSRVAARSTVAQARQYDAELRRFG